MRGVQLGLAAAQNLGLLQAAQRGSGGGSSALGAFAAGDHDSRRRDVETESDDRVVDGGIGVAVGNGYSSCLRSTEL